MASKSDRPTTRQAKTRNASSPYPKPSSRPSRRNTGGEPDSDGHTDGGSGNGNRSARQQYSACGACRHRRVKCDLKDMAVIAAPGVRPVCSNCTERGFNCVDEYAETGKSGKQKLLRRGRRIQTAEAIFGKAPDSADQPSIIPPLELEFFSSAFFRRFHVQRPIIEPTEFSARYSAHINGDATALDSTGILLSKTLVVWAASFGHNEAGQPFDDEQPLMLGDDAHELSIRRRDWAGRVNAMVEELLRIIDALGVLRKPSWDGVRALLLLLPLTVDSTQPQIERLAMFEATLCQIYTLCSLAPLPASGDDIREQLVRARIFWGAYTKEGITSGLRGGRLILDDEDLRAFQRTLPPGTTSPSDTTSSSSHFAYARRDADVVLDISSACRMVHAALTGPRARQRMDHIDERLLKKAWELLETTWNRLQERRGSHSMDEENERFISSWQIFIFEAYNVIREALKQRVLALKSAHFPASVDGHRIQQQASQLHEHSLNKCHDLLQDVLEIIKLHVPGHSGMGDSFFAYDASIVRDGCFFAAILLTTRESSAIGYTETDLRGDIDSCVTALRSMRWAFSKSEEREQSIEQAWERRMQRLNTSPTAATFPGNTFHYTIPPLSSDRPAPPLLPVPVLRDSRPATGGAAWPGLSVAASASSSTDHPFAYSSYPSTPAHANYHPPAVYQPLFPAVTPPESSGSRPSTAGGPGEQVGSLSRTLPYPGPAPAIDQPFLVNSRLDTTGHNVGLSHSVMPRSTSHGLGVGMSGGPSGLSLLSTDIHHTGAHGSFVDGEPTSATSTYPPWQTLHIGGAHH